MKKKLFTLSLIITSAVYALAQPGEGQIAFKDAQLDMAYKNYIQLKDALVASKADVAKAAAGKLKTSLATIKDKNPDNCRELVAEASKIAGAATLSDIRKIFAKLSAQMTTLVKGSHLSKGMLYLEYCPMANNNEGAFWLSNDKEIKNPYFGDKMLKCGSVKEMIH